MDPLTNPGTVVPPSFVYVTSSPSLKTCSGAKILSLLSVGVLVSILYCEAAVPIEVKLINTCVSLFLNLILSLPTGSTLYVVVLTNPVGAVPLTTVNTTDVLSVKL